MCRWKSSVIFIVLCKHLTAQPIANIDNDRTPRQLDFGECCPCNSNDNTIEGYDGVYDAVGANSESTFSRPRDLDDCPCRYSDSQGASSIFFPNALRSAGTFLRSDDKKENLKPLFNPEVDLAASVLKTLREVTDEEYQEALVRDAVKSAAKADDDFIFGDAIPEESANIVVVQRSFAASNEVVAPEVLHSQKSRCIHPIDSSRSASKQRMLPQSSFTLHKPSKTRPTIFHRNFGNADNGVGASNVYEQIISSNLDAKDLDIDPSYLRSDTDESNFSSNSDIDHYCNVGKLPNLRSARIPNKFKDLNRPNLLKNIRENPNKLSRIPKIKSRTWLLAKSEKNNADLNSAASEHELVETKVPYFRTKSDRLNITENSGPWSLKNLLNLRDVELIPLKKLLSKQTKRDKIKKPNVLLPFISSRDAMQGINSYDVADSNNNSVYNSDLELLNSKESSDNDEIIKNESKKGLLKYESTSKHLDTETKALISPLNKELTKKNNVQSDNDCIGFENEDQEDSMIGASNRNEKIVEEPRTLTTNIEQYLKNIQSVPAEIFNQKELSQLSTEIFDRNTEIKLFEPISIDKTISTIKEKIDKKLEDLKNMRTSIKSENIRDSIKIPVTDNINHVKECEVEVFDPVELTDEVDDVTTTLNPILSDNNLIGRINNEETQNLQSHILGDNLGDVNEYDSNTLVTAKYLEKLSNSLLQQEEKGLESNIKDQIQLQEIENYTDSDIATLSPSEHLQYENGMKPIDVDNLNEGKSANTCKSTVSLQLGLTDDSIEVTIVTEKTISTEDDTVSLPPSSGFVDLTHLPTVKPLKLITLFDKTDGETNVMRAELSSNLKDGNVMQANTFHDLQRVNIEKYNNETSLDLIGTLKKDPNDQSIDSSNTIIKAVPKDGDTLYTPENLQSQLSFLREPLSNVNDMYNIVPHKTLLDDIKVKLTHLFDRSETNRNRLSSRDSAYVYDIGDSVKCGNFNEESMDIYNSQSESVTSNAPLLSTVDTDVEAKDMDKIAKNQDNDVLNTQPILQPQASILKEPLADLNDILNTITPKTLPTIDDLKLKLTNLHSNNEREINSLEKAGNDENKLIDNRIFKITQGKNTLALPERLQLDKCVSDVGAGEAILNMVPKYDDNLSFKTVLQPPLNLTDKLNLSPLKSLRSDIRVKPPNLLDSNDRNIEINQLELPASKLKSNTLDLLNPVMATDASTSNFQTRIPSSRLLNNNNLNIWELNPQTGERKSKLRVPKVKKLRPLNDDLLGTIPTTNKISKFQRNQNSPSILRFPIDISQSLVNARERNSDRPVKTKEKYNFHSIFRNLENPLESTLQQIQTESLKPLKKQLSSSSNILDKIAKNHEDFNDKIRTLHTDFNDRIESVRKDILGRSKSPANESPIAKDLFKSSSNLRNQNKPNHVLNYVRPKSIDRPPKTFLSPLKSKAPKPIQKISLPRIESNKFRMPTAASVLVPKTVQVDDLKPTSRKPPLPPLPRESVTSGWNAELSDTKQRPESLRKQTSNFKDLHKQYNSKKKAIVKFSFSTTPLPPISTDHEPSLKLYNKLTPNKLSASDTLEAAPIEISAGDSNSLNSWSRTKDSSFLSKVKDAVQSKLSAVSPTNLKQSRLRADDTKNSKNAALSTDMTHAASEHGNINDMSLRENVSYKCNMVCTKE